MMPDKGHIDSLADEAAEYLRKTIPLKIRTGIVLGSGLGTVREAFRTVRTFAYRDIPHFPISTVQGHEGRLIVAKRGNHGVVIMDGRVHRYEGYGFSTVTFPVRVFRRLGVSAMIITNASGSVSSRFRPGDILLIEDHIDLMWRAVSELSRGPQVMHRPYYSRRLTELAEEIGVAEGIAVKKGVLLATTGPSYETPAEVEFARTAGADAATMSTIPEVTLCHDLGIAVLGMSLITNVAAGHSGGHEEVVGFAEKGSRNLQKIVAGVIDVI
jgi:purine-nucleoside phosphorylase